MPARYPLAYVTYGNKEIDAVMKTLRAGQTTCGPRVAEFESAFAKRVGREHAIMVNSGSSADLLVAFGLGPADEGDEVIIPAVTWPTQVWSCIMAGYRVRLADVLPGSLQVSLDSVSANVNSHTRAIFAVHVLGNVGNMDGLVHIANDRNLKVVEDCCEALGSLWDGKSVGTFGSAAAFSFFFSHLLNTMEGGMVVTDSDVAAHNYRLWRSHGWEPKTEYRFWFPTWGLNIRPTEVQGAFGSVQLARMGEFRAARQINAASLAAYTWALYPGLLDGISVSDKCDPAWHGFPIMVSDAAPFTRTEFCQHLEAHGIETRPIVAGNLASQPAIQSDGRVLYGELPGADRVHSQGFYIGVASFIDTTGTAYVAQVVRDFVKKK